jgi:hypothetical protein
MNIVLITSIIETKLTPLSYTETRSVFTKLERFEQTKHTIETLKKIPDRKVFLIECSQLTDEENLYFNNNCDIFINLYDLKNQSIINNINSPSKSLGEGTMTIFALDYLFNNKIKFNNLFKISGRYWLNDKFDYEIYDNDKIVAQYIKNFGSTALYKLPFSVSRLWFEHLKNSGERFFKCDGYEQIFASFLDSIENNDLLKPLLLNCNSMGLSGYVSVSGGYLEC